MKVLQERLEFSSLIKSPIESKLCSFKIYLSYMWHDLNNYNDLKMIGISRKYFANYFAVPGIINTRLFTVFDKNKDDHLDQLEFSAGLTELFSGEFYPTSKLIFDIYDFDEDGEISEEDVSIVFYHLSSYENSKKKSFSNNISEISNKKTYSEYSFYSEEITNQKNYIERITKRFFRHERKINYDQFIFIIQNTASDVFIYPLSFFYDNKPFNENTLNLFNNENSELAEEEKDSLIEKIDQIILIACPQPFFGLPVSLLPINHRGKIQNSKYNSIVKSTAVISEDEYTDDMEEEVAARSIKYNLYKFLDMDLNKIFTQLTKSSSNFSQYENAKTDASSCNGESNVIKRGYIYKLNKKNEIIRLWYVLSGNDLFVYRNSSSNRILNMKNLSSCVIQQQETIELNEIKHFSFSLNFPKNKKVYYFQNYSEFSFWFFCLINICKNDYMLHKNYKIGDIISEGKFGIVRAATNLITNQNVAIKIIENRLVSGTYSEVFRNELKILKICRHPNLIHLCEVYENVDFVYVITKLFTGGDLSKFITKSKSKLDEYHVFTIVHQISHALKYLKQFGIVHRDINPNNILLKENYRDLQNLQVILIDFGLAKILGPNELTNDLFGTMRYIAPEVMIGDDYNVAVDMWSLGVLSYELICGETPFDHPFSEDEIYDQVVYKEPSFNKRGWNISSFSAMHFVKNLLVKNPKKRMSIEDVLTSPWFNIYSLKLAEALIT